jgi:hypothetical protein
MKRGEDRLFNIVFAAFFSAKGPGSIWQESHDLDEAISTATVAFPPCD